MAFFSIWTCCVLIFVGETGCMMIFLFVKLVHWFSSSWYLHIDLSPRETDFVHRTCWVLIFIHGTWFSLIFVRETYIMLIFLFVKLVHWFFSSWNWFCSWTVLWRPSDVAAVFYWEGKRGCYWSKCYSTGSKESNYLINMLLGEFKNNMQYIINHKKL